MCVDRPLEHLSERLGNLHLFEKEGWVWGGVEERGGGHKGKWEIGIPRGTAFVLEENM